MAQIGVSGPFIWQKASDAAGRNSNPVARFKLPV
jgi:hypothetical protein